MPVDDKKSFSERLKTALKRLPRSIETAAELAHNFNLKHRNDPITPQAAQKWLAGTAFPTADKLETLAECFGSLAEERPSTTTEEALRRQAWSASTTRPVE